MGDVDAVLASNGAFYAAFEARDVVAMTALWSGHGDVLCTHPGWRTLHGDDVLRSWLALLTNTQHLQFIVTNEHVTVASDAAWVTCDENILDSGTGGGASGGTVTALNLFRRRGDGTWQLVGHHGSPVAG